MAVQRCVKPSRGGLDRADDRASATAAGASGKRALPGTFPNAWPSLVSCRSRVRDRVMCRTELTP
jgi:hypothetical protein